MQINRTKCSYATTKAAVSSKFPCDKQWATDKTKLDNTKIRMRGNFKQWLQVNEDKNIILIGTIYIQLHILIRNAIANFELNKIQYFSPHYWLLEITISHSTGEQSIK